MTDVILPLKLDREKKLPKDQSLTFKLRTDPADAASPIYEYTVPYVHGHEGARTAIQFKKDLTTVCTGMNITTVPNSRIMAQRILKGEAKAAFDRQFQIAHDLQWELLRVNARNASIANGDDQAAQDAAYAGVARPVARQACLDSAVMAVIKHMAPFRALQRVKRWLRRSSRKPADMSVSEYFTAIQRINNEEIPHLPPGRNDQQLSSDEEVLEIIHFGLPNSWKNEMARQGFDPLTTMNMASLLEFCQRLEDLPEFQPVERKPSSTDNKKKSSPKKSTGGDKYCLIHGKGSHDSNDCNTLKAQAKRLKDDRSSKSDGGSKNKSWSRKSEEDKKKSAKQLNAFIKKTVKAQLNVISDKKRKADSDTEEEEGFLAEAGEIDLSQFNYSDMDDLKIDSADEEEFHDADMDSTTE